MEKWLNETLFSNQDYEYLVSTYNTLFSIFKNIVWKPLLQEFGIDGDEKVVWVERWLWNEISQIFWDYLWASHGSIECISRSQDDLIDNKFTYRCVKLKFKGNKSIVLSTDAKLNSIPHGVLALDKIYMELSNEKRQVFDKVLFELNKFESEHFTSHEFAEKFREIRLSSKDCLYQALNIKEVNFN